MATPQIKARLVLDTGGGGLAGAAATGGGGKGLGGAMGFGKLAGAVGAGMLALDAIKKMMGKLVSSSPRLQATMNIINKSIGLLLRPIGDTLALFLKPFAIGMLRFAIPFYKKWYNSDFFKTAMTEGVGEAIKDKTIFGKEGGLESPGGAFRNEEGKPIGTALGLIPATIDFAKGIGDKLNEVVKKGEEKLSSFGDTIGKGITQGIDSAGTFFMDTLPGAIGTLDEKLSAFGDKIGSFFAETLPEVWGVISGAIGTFFGETFPEIAQKVWDKIILFFTETFPEAIMKLWNLIKDFFLVKIPEWTTSAFNYLKDVFLVKIPAWVGEMASKASSLISDAISSVKSFFGFGGETKSTKSSKKVKDALITKTGQVVQIDPNDNLLAFKGNGAGAAGPNINLTVNISAMDAYSFDSSLINKITTQITENLKRGLQGRSSYGIGI